MMCLYISRPFPLCRLIDQNDLIYILPERNSQRPDYGLIDYLAA
jgi:hypothetical protein